jgi:hypothetical protein
MTGAPLLPELGDAPPLTCSRVGCSADATWHVIHDEDMVNGLACDRHMAEFRHAGWTYYRAHPYKLDCSAPSAVFIIDENRCQIVPPESVAVRAIHSVQANALVFNRC